MFREREKREKEKERVNVWLPKAAREVPQLMPTTENISDVDGFVSVLKIKAKKRARVGVNAFNI